MKALVVSVGTGSRLGMQAAESVVSAIAQSVRHHNPERGFFVVSRQSKERTLPLVVGKAGLTGESTRQ